MPHSTRGSPGRSGLDVYISHRPDEAPAATIRGAGGAVTVTVLVSGRGPVSVTSRLVRPPAGTGTCIVPPCADQCSPPWVETASSLWARTCLMSVPSWDVKWIITVLEAGENVHPRCSGTGAAPARPRQLATSATSDSAMTNNTVRRNLTSRE